MSSTMKSSTAVPGHFPFVAMQLLCKKPAIGFKDPAASSRYIKSNNLDLCIQLKSPFQGIIINLIIDNMKTILAFLALAALAAARPQGDGDAPACPDEMPIQCDGKYIFYFFYLCT